MKNELILQRGTMGFQLNTQDPFIVTMHHMDHFPPATREMAPATTDGKGSRWQQYYGDTVPGFPEHPHRGFETVTVVTQGYVDHSDGLGAQGRYGEGDVQWLTAGGGVQHAEMFPLLHEDRENPMELFQIWLNLDRAHQMAPPDYKMLWAEAIPVVTATAANGACTRVTVIAGAYDGVTALTPTPNSWAARPEHHVGILLAELEAGAEMLLPAVSPTHNRAVYVYEGGKVSLADTDLHGNEYAFLNGNEAVSIVNTGSNLIKLLVLEGEPIGEPVVSDGPFVLTSNEENRQAYEEYRRTRFGGWPYDKRDPVNPKDSGRFARYADGRIEYPPVR